MSHIQAIVLIVLLIGAALTTGYRFGRRQPPIDPSASHMARFRVLYLQAMIAVASAVAGEFGPMKDMTHEQLAALTWVAWSFLVCNIVINAGNVIIASLHPSPSPKPTP